MPEMIYYKFLIHHVFARLSAMIMPIIKPTFTGALPKPSTSNAARLSLLCYPSAKCFECPQSDRPDGCWFNRRGELKDQPTSGTLALVNISYLMPERSTGNRGSSHVAADVSWSLPFPERVPSDLPTAGL